MALEHSEWPLDITVAQDGEKAVTILREMKVVPDFVLLDLNLPRLDGTEVLRVIRTTEGTTETPVAILSSSPQDVIQSRLTSAGVNADFHLTKPAGFDDYLKLGLMLKHYYEESRSRTTRVWSSES